MTDKEANSPNEDEIEDLVYEFMERVDEKIDPDNMTQDEALEWLKDFFSSIKYSLEIRIKALEDDIEING